MASSILGIILADSCIYWYGVDGEQVLKEDSILKIPSGKARQQAYAISKLTCENLAQASDLHCTIACIFNVFGPNQRSSNGFVIPTWIDQCLKNEPMTIFGNGCQLRSFCYIDDVTKALALLMEKNFSKGEIFNVGSQECISLVK